VTEVPRALARIPSSILYELAQLREQEETAADPWHRLPEEKVDEALRMLSANSLPALGWWKAAVPRREMPADWPPLPPNRLRDEWDSWELVAAAIDLASDGVNAEVAKDVLAALAAAHGLGAEQLADAYLALTLEDANDRG
jgi:hypothetical protein